MAIKEGDVVLLKSRVMADVPEGGGGPSGNVIADGKSNDIFSDVSDADRILGNVALRQVHVCVRSESTEPIMGAYATVSQPADPNVSALLFDAGGQFVERSEAVNRLEAWLFAGPMWPGFLLENHIRGMRSIQICLHPRNASIKPAIGQTLWLVQNEGKPTQVSQYVRITDVSVVTRAFVDKEGASYDACVQTLSLSDPLESDFEGTPHNKNFSASATGAVLRDTTVADAARYYGCSRLQAPVAAGDLLCKTSSIYGQLIPGSQVETPLLGLNAAGNGAGLISAGKDAWCSFNTTQPLNDANRLALGGACEPGSLSIATANGELTDSGGKLMRAEQVVGTVDYADGIVHCTQTSIGASKAVRFRAAVASVQHYDSAGYPVTAPNRSFNWSHTLPARAAPCTLHVAYMASGRWYELWDDGSGVLRGTDSAWGVGRIDADGISASVTLGALPDVGSEVLWFWAIDGDYDASNPAAGEQLPLYTVLELGRPMASDGCTITWHDGKDAQGNPITKRATCGVTGLISGDATGHADAPNGILYLHLARLPDKGQPFVITTAQELSWNAPVGGFQVDGEGTLSITLGRAISPGSITVHVPMDAEPFEKSTSSSSSYSTGGNSSGSESKTCTPLTYVARMRDDGAGQLRGGNISGTVDYSTGAILIRAACKMEFSCRVTESKTSTAQGWGTSTTYRAGTETWPLYGKCKNATNATVQFAQPSSAVPAPPLTVQPARVQGQIAGVSVQIHAQHALLQFRGALTLDGSTSQNAVAAGGLIVPVADAPARVPVGTYNHATGDLVLQRWSTGADARFAVLSLLRRHNTQPLVYNLVWRVPQIPLRPMQLSLRATAPDGTPYQARDNADGNFAGNGVEGRVNATTGVARARFASGVLPESLRYNALAYSYLPLGADVLGLNPVRLPQDGRVPIYRTGGIVVFSHELSTEPLTVSNAQRISLGRERLSRVRVSDDKGRGVSAGFTVNLDAGEVTFVDVAGIEQPVRITHYIEDAAQVIDVQIDGTIKLGAPIGHDYPAGSRVHSALYLGTRFARVSRVFDQEAWDGKTWRDELLGNVAVASYNTRTSPIEVSNRGAVSQRWALRLAPNGSAVDVIGEHVGLLGRYSINTDIAPINPQENTPYFTIRATGWGGGWVPGNVLFIHTVAAGAPLWLARTTQKSPNAAVADDRFEITVYYNVDRPGPDQT